MLKSCFYHSVAIAALGGLLLPAPAIESLPPLYRLHLLEPPDASPFASSEGSDLAENGFAAGTFTNAPARWKPVCSSFSRTVIVPPSGFRMLHGYGANNSGDVVGQGDSQTGTRGFLSRTDGTFVDLGALPRTDLSFPNSTALGLNDAGLIVGSSNDIPVFWKDLGGATVTGPTVLDGGTGQANDVNDDGDIVGEARKAAVAWKGTGAAPIVLPGADGFPNTDGAAQSISPNGIIVGYVGHGRSALRWIPNAAGSAYTAQPLTHITGSGAAYAYGVNSRGFVVGTSVFHGVQWRATLWDPSGEPYDLNHLIHPDSVIPDLTLTTAQEINDMGWIIAQGSLRRGGAKTVILTPVGCQFDVTRDGKVDLDDAKAVTTAWGACPALPLCCPADADHNGVVDVDDLRGVTREWGPCPGSP